MTLETLESVTVKALALASLASIVLMFSAMANADVNACATLVKSNQLTETRCERYETEETADIVNKTSIACEFARALDCDLN
jgi:hypothetical protein